MATNNLTGDAEASTRRCGMCGSCGSAPPWAPEELAKVSPAERKALFERMRLKQEIFVRERDAALARLKKTEEKQEHIVGEEDNVATEAEKNIYVKQGSTVPSGDGVEKKAPVQVQTFPNSLAESAAPERLEVSAVASGQEEDAKSFNRVDDSVGASSPVLPKQSLSTVHQNVESSDHRKLKKPGEPKRVGRTRSPLFSNESDADSFHTAGDGDLPSLSLDEIQLNKVPIEGELQAVHLGGPNASTDVTNSRRKGTDKGGNENSETDLRNQAQHFDKREVVESNSSIVDTAPHTEDDQQDIDDIEFSNWHAFRSQPGDDENKATVADITTSVSLTPETSRTGTQDEEPDDPRPDPPILSMYDLEPGKSLLSIPSENLEETVSSRRTPVRGHSRPDSKVHLEDYPLPPDVVPLRSTTEIALDSTPPRRDAALPHCFDCDAWRGRVEELQHKVEALTSALSAREMECASLRAKCSGKMRTPARNEARLVQECESLRVTTEFLVSFQCST